jgi:hypothetical protein
MSSPKPFEERLLSSALQILDEYAQSKEERLELLEAAASIYGGFRLCDYRHRFPAIEQLNKKALTNGAEKLVAEIHKSDIPVPLALSSLARPRIALSEQRSSGSYYTDFRLAQHVANHASPYFLRNARVIDPASGTGILLVAAALAFRKHDQRLVKSCIANSLTAWDLSADALRGAQLAIASMTKDLGPVSEMVTRWACHDSLLVDDNLFGQFDVVLGNPPWEKVKLTRHEYLKANGLERHYGDAYESLDGENYNARRDRLSQYGDQLAKRYPLLGSGEPDLYKAFLELFVKLVADGGCISVLVPAGLIRSQGTGELRHSLFSNADDLSMTVIDNRSHFFAIDTRFKFLSLVLTKASHRKQGRALNLFHAKGTPHGIDQIGKAVISRNTLRSLRPDLTVPEVRSESEWRLFRKMSRNAESVADNGVWKSEIVREVDMTRDRKNFSHVFKNGMLPLIEGRMVHQHRFGAKIYRCGTGRRAVWDLVAPGRRIVKPQFWYPEVRLADSIRSRISTIRAGFCDITGQTNERTMSAALIPPGVVCGNKVPTVTFPHDQSEDRLFLWVAIVNSLPFDWAIRRLVTTTVNYFLLNGVPFPRICPYSPLGRQVVIAARRLQAIDSGEETFDPWEVANLRANIDAAIHQAYGLDFNDLELMLRDFPLLDRGQPPISNEARSTVTKDFLLTVVAKRINKPAPVFSRRLSIEIEGGAIPYNPSESVSVEVTYDEVQ